jgi:hypothetical protein
MHRDLMACFRLFDVWLNIGVLRYSATASKYIFFLVLGAHSVLRCSDEG